MNERGYCVVVVSEGVKNSKGKFLAESDKKDAFGHSQLGGVAPFISNLINNKLKLKNHWAVADYRWEEFRTFTSFHVTKDINKVLKLSFRSKGEDIEVGAFLNEDDKNVLKQEVSNIIDTLNA